MEPERNRGSMGIEEIWETYTPTERELFQKACRRLLKCTFLVRDRDEESRKAYFFVARDPGIFSRYLGYIGFDVVVDRDNGVAMLRNSREASEDGRMLINRLALRKAESVVLCCLWTLYADRLRTGKLSRTVEIALADLRRELETYGVKDQIDKSGMAGILSLLSRYQLLDVNGRVGDETCRIRLYPSLQFALDPEEFRRLAKLAARRMHQGHAEQEEGWERQETEEQPDEEWSREDSGESQGEEEMSDE